MYADLFEEQESTVVWHPFPDTWPDDDDIYYVILEDEMGLRYPDMIFFDPDTRNFEPSGKYSFDTEVVAYASIEIDDVFKAGGVIC